MHITTHNQTKVARSGMTIVEILVVLSILVLVGFAVASLMSDTFSLNRMISNSLNASGEARRALKTMMSETRTASPSNSGTFALESTATSSFIFYSDIDTDPLKERVRYFLSGTTLKKGVIKPTGNPSTYGGAEVVTDLVHSVANGTTPLFSYYDAAYSGTTSPLSGNFDLTLVRLVKFTIGINNDPNSGATSTWYTTQVSFRNLKDNL